MTKAVAMQLESGDTVWVEVEDVALAAVPAASSDTYRTRMGPGTAVQRTFNFKDAVSRIREPVNEIISTLQNLPILPTKLNVEFSVRFSGEGGIIFASAKGEAGMVIKLEWTPNPAPEPPAHAAANSASAGIVEPHKIGS